LSDTASWWIFRRDQDAERDTTTRRHHRDEPDVEDDEPLDVQPLQFEMLDEDMHEAHPEAEDKVDCDDGGEGDDEGGAEEEEVEFQNSFEGQPDPDVFLGGPFDKSALTEYGRHIARCIYANVVSYLIMQLYLNRFIQQVFMF
jgi:hypothetical protein